MDKDTKVSVDIDDLADIMQAIKTIVGYIPSETVVDTATGYIPVCVTLEVLVNQANVMVMQLLEGAEHA